MKITFFTGSLEEGGAERVISNLSKCFVKSGIEVTLLLYQDKELYYEIDKDVELRIISRETNTTNIFRNLLWLRNYIEKNGGIILSFLAPFNMLALVASIGIKTPIIVADRNDPRHVPGNNCIRKLRDILYLFADFVVVQTKYNKEYFCKKVQMKCAVIYNPVDIGDYSGAAIQTKKEKKIVSVGRLMPQKNQRMLITAFKKICDDYPDYKLVIYGDGPARDELQAHITSLGINGKVLLAGSEKNIFEQIKNAGLFVLSSDYEGMPNALIEAMCLGLPCISTKVSGATDLIEDGINGILVNVGNVDEMEMAFRNILSDDSYAGLLGRKAAEVSKELETKEIAQKWLTLVTRFI